MESVAFFDAKDYDRLWFDRLNTQYSIRYIENRLDAGSAYLARGCTSAIAFVDDAADRAALRFLSSVGVRFLAMRCAGYNNVDLAAAREIGIRVACVPAYSPHAVAEHAMALLLTLNRKTHKAYNRTREFNFSLSGLIGFDLYGKTAGIVGTGRIGRAMIDICRGFGMRVAAYDPYPTPDADFPYWPLADVLSGSDIVSLHCPLTRDTRHMIDEKAFAVMRPNAILINTSRGELIDTRALIDALRHGRIHGACLDVYEEEEGLFFRDASEKTDRDEALSLLVSMPNVIVTSHQAYLTDEALSGIARSVLTSLDQYYTGAKIDNEIGRVKDAAPPPARPAVADGEERTSEQT